MKVRNSVRPSTWPVWTGVLVAALTACGGDDEGDSQASSSTSGSGLSTGSSGQGGSTSGSGGSMGVTTSSSSSSTGQGGQGAGGTEPICPPGLSGQDPLPSSLQAETVAGGYSFIEGPVWLKAEGALFFSDMNFGGSGSDGVPPSTIHRLTPPSTVTVFSSSIDSNGLALGIDGSIVACTHDERSVSRVDPVTQARTTLASAYMGKKFNSPNDAIVRSDGTIYFTDPTWQLGNRPQEINFKGVYRVDPQGEVHLVSDDFGSPNGIALSVDESTLYVADDQNGHVRSFDVATDGSTSGGEVHVPNVYGVDGIGVDCADNLYLTSHQGVIVTDASGQSLGTIQVGQKASNVTFGGADRKTLYITATNTLYEITMKVPGLP